MKNPILFVALIISSSIFSQMVDINGKSYKTVIIGSQTWMSENLNVSKFKNGDIIAEVKTDAEWDLAGDNKQPAWCYYNNDPINGEKYGRIYNWWAVSDPRGLAPDGWHVPTEEEYDQLMEFLGGFYRGPEKLKSTSGFRYYCSNESGFSALPGGYREYHSSLSDFASIGYDGYWWTSTGRWIVDENKITVGGKRLEYGDCRYLLLGSGSMDSEIATDEPGYGYYVRCVKN